jgi:hypothetical protein
MVFVIFVFLRNASATVIPRGFTRRSKARVSLSASIATSACPRVRPTLRRKIGRNSSSPVFNVRKSRSTR